MVKRKCLILAILLLSSSEDSCAGPWLQPQGKTQLINSINIHAAHHNNAKYVRESKLYYALDHEIVELYELQNSIKHDNRLTEEAKQHRLIEVEREILAMRKAQRHVSKDYIKYEASLYGEYGFSHDVTGGINLNYSQKSDIQKGSFAVYDLALFSRHPLYQKKTRIVSIQPEIVLEEDIYLGTSVLFGKSKKYKYFNYWNAREVKVQLKNLSEPVFMINLTEGAKFKYDWQIMLYSSNRFDYKSSDIFKNISYDKISLVKSFKNPWRKVDSLSFEIGAFKKFSIRSGSQLSEGFVGGVWLEF